MPAEFDPNLVVYLILGIGGLITASILGKNAITNRMEPGDVKALKEQVKLWQDTSETWKTAYKKMKGKAYQHEIPPQVNGDPADFENVIPGIIQQYKHMAPKWAQPLLNTPGISDLLIKLAKEHPKDAKEFISSFIKPVATESQDQQSPQLPAEFA